MTAVRLGRVESPRYALVGKCTNEQAVSHVGILECPGMLEQDQVVLVFHMKNWKALLELPGEMQAHAVGWIEDLTGEEYDSIDAWLSELKTGAVRITYCALPAADVEIDRVTGRPIGRKFSCAGFVHCCFDEAIRIKLVVPEDILPPVGLDVLVQVWGEGVRVAQRSGRFGLRGPGPWRILLPSYLFQSLAGTRATMPYRPDRVDACFPGGAPLLLERTDGGPASAATQSA